jgi:hypothetical protein
MKDDDLIPIWTNGHKYWFIYKDNDVSKLTHKKYPEGLEIWYKNNQLHYKHGPAVVYKELHQEWYWKGKLHRKNGPAIIYPNGDQEWWIHGKRHRIGKPAVVDSDRREEWWVNGKLHREGGPAVCNSNGYKEWWVNGVVYRTDGPARIYSNGDKEWHTIYHSKLVFNTNFKTERYYHIDRFTYPPYREDGPSRILQNGKIEWLMYFVMNKEQISYQQMYGQDQDFENKIIVKDLDIFNLFFQSIREIT